jgi:hypothetical protein
VDFDITDQLLIRYSIFIRYWRKSENIMGQYSIDFERAYDSVTREVVHSILIEFGIPLKLVRLIKMCLNENF